LLLRSRATVRTGIAGDASFFSRHATVSPTSGDTTKSRQALRRKLWKIRDAMPRAARAAAERRIVASLARSPWLRPGSAVGLYVSRGSEVDTAPLRALARRRGCRVYLPRITHYAARRMMLLPEQDGPLRLNRYRIGEPVGVAAIRPQALAVVLMPLVGFDDFGTRLGNGAGYYDRFLTHRHGTRANPELVGIAFECQRCQRLEPAAHDVPLDAVVTERGIQYFRRRL
jgi:5-formyltetrahydrofolate cyclo-ligase